MDADAYFGHWYVNPMDVEYADFEEDDDRVALLWMASQLMQGVAISGNFRHIVMVILKRMEDLIE